LAASDDTFYGELAIVDRHHALRRCPVSKVVVVTSGKGGVGKTTTSANLAAGLASMGFRTVAIDFDVGLRNLDLVMGCERRVVYDFVNVIRGEASVRQAVIRDKRLENLFILPASQTRDKEALTQEGVGRVIEEFKSSGFDFIICDSPAGIEWGAQMAMFFADEAIVVTNPEVSSVRDSDRILGLLDAKTQRATEGLDAIKTHLLLTRYSPERVAKGEMLSYHDVVDLLRIPLAGVIPESPSVLQSSNAGAPVILDPTSVAAQAYLDLCRRFTGEEVPFRFLEPVKRSFFNRIFGGGGEAAAYAG
jgi:septum site-determining protein MinD